MTTYKGFKIQTNTNGQGSVSLIYKDGELKGSTVSDLTANGLNSEQKAEIRIDCLLNGTDYHATILDIYHSRK